MSDSASRADWTQVGDSFRSFGQSLRSKLTPTDASVTEPAKAAKAKADQAVDDFTTSVTEALNRLSEATNDPDVTGSAKAAVNSLIDAVQTEIGSRKLK